MNVLVVYAHPNPKSFNHAILEQFTKGLRDSGHSFDVLDLYAMKFDSHLGTSDFAAYGEGAVPADIKKHQEMIAAADGLVFIYPIWWWHSPAIVKGWIDRVLTLGFAFNFGDTGPEGLLKHTKALFINTTMGHERQYRDTGLDSAIKKMDVATFRFVCGIKHVEHAFLFSVGDNDEVRRGYLEKVYNLGKEF